MDRPLLLDGQRFADAGTVSASSSGTLLTHSGSANTKGGYTQLIASTTFDAHGFLLQLANGSAAVTQSYLLDLAIGAAAAEHVILANLLFDTGSAAAHIHACVWVPLPIPAGTRIAARFQNNATSGAPRVSLILLGAGAFGVPFGGRLATLGADTSASNGQIIDPGGTTHTKGAYTELSASTSHDIRALILAVGSNRNSTTAAASWLIDLAVGAAASEQVKIPNLLVTSGGSRLPLPAFIGPIPCTIPAGTRIAMRAQSGTNNATDRLFAAVAYGIG